MKRVEDPIRGGGGVLEEEGWHVTDLLDFEGPLCGLLQQGRPLHKKKRDGAGSREGAGTLAPAAGSMAECQLTHSSPVDQMFLVRELLAFNKLSYTIRHKAGQTWARRLPCHTHHKYAALLKPFCMSYRSNSGEGLVFSF